MKIGSLILLLFLTLVVAAYNYQFHNIPCSMYLNAYKLSPSEEESGHVQFYLKLPSLGIPHEYRDVTHDGGFRCCVIDYVKASDTVRDLIKIPKLSTAEWWLGNASNSSKGYDMTIQFFDDSYFLQVRYYPDFLRTHLEHEILWAINIVTVVAWLLFAASSIQKLKAEKEEKTKNVVDT